MHMYQVDTFTDRLFAGNPAAVLVVDDWLPDALMLAIAQENNLAETAFVKVRSDGAWDLRWFAPAHEVDFCGHATLATAHVLLTETKAEAPLVFHTRVGELRVTQGPHAYRLDIPRLPPEPLETLPAEIAGVFDNPPVRIFRNFESIFADLGSADAVRSFVPDFDSIARLGSVGLVVTGAEAGNGRAHFVSRYFAPGAGIPEDRSPGQFMPPWFLTGPSGWVARG
ncbi:PhzF family phenazine biosynthesis protein [Mesorhizobium sp. M0276]|uniref:PhzF family phenazine biosynthesis protein n=1 Tax=Mesorhizobium sp. M0276 TaxID=2956928 RepID=UPI003336DE92